ncbi:ORF94 [Plodia interpunctella granulovirus]|uniref:ORF94 n=1 Tax=Plodia interpunctella granulovirus TaxID=262175 RepID=A0A1L5JH45_9BBAC|nr:ORF94 [Plodia interpunctella granulovirus]APO13976.1 ORF94 [Plodia interpunctella granulovirus]
MKMTTANPGYYNSVNKYFGTMMTISLIVGLIVLAFILNRFGGSEVIVTILVLMVLFFCILHYYYTDSSPENLYNENTKKIKKKQQLTDAFDALLNKNNSSIE